MIDKHKRLGKYILSFNAPDEDAGDGEWGIGVSVSYPMTQGGIRTYMVGIGWDEDEPLRPWPGLHHHNRGQGLYLRKVWTFAWCGLFFNIMTAR